MEFVRVDHKDIPGWGVDADKAVRPAYPMWKSPEQGTGAHWAVPEQQPGFNDFYSMERPGPTKVFGNTVPPKGLSGVIRKFAFAKYSEGAFEHWMLLMLADRINVIEGLFEDVFNGVLPRPLLERGWNVDKKFKTKRYKKVVTLSALLLLAVPFLLLSSKKESQ